MPRKKKAPLGVTFEEVDALREVLKSVAQWVADPTWEPRARYESLLPPLASLRDRLLPLVAGATQAQDPPGSHEDDPGGQPTGGAGSEDPQAPPTA